MSQMNDLISRQAAIDAMKDALDPHIVQFVKSKMAIEALPSAQPEPSEITDEQAILHLQSTGWMQNHDREIYESGLREQLADDSRSYDSLIPCEGTISRQAAIEAMGRTMWAKERLEELPSAQPEDCDTCKHGYFGDNHCETCRVRYPSHYERRTDERTD